MTSYRLKILAAAAVFAGAVAFIAGPTAFAVDGIGVPLDLFELDGNPQDPGGAGLPDDWETLFDDCDPLVDPTICGNADVFTGILADPADPTDSSIFTGGGSKDIKDISTGGETANAWLHDAGSTPDKDDITNAFAAAYVNDTEVCVDVAGAITGCPGFKTLHAVDDLIIYFGADRFDNNGDAFLGFWFFQDNITLTADPLKGGFEFDGNHLPGDILVLVEYPQGTGAMPEVKVLEWDPSVVKADADFAADNLRLLIAASDALCDGLGGKIACAITNDASVPSIWPYTPKGGAPADPYPIETFYSGGINVSQLTGTSLCISSFMAETRSSRSETAQLKDFVLGAFATCSAVPVTQIHDAGVHDVDIQGGTRFVGDMIHDFVTVTGTNLAGSAPDPSGTVTFTLFPTNNCTGTPVLGPTIIAIPGDVTDDGVVTIDNALPRTLVLADVGNLSYKAVYNGDENFPSTVNAACEPLVVQQPKLKIRKLIINACEPPPDGGTFQMKIGGVNAGAAIGDGQDTGFVNVAPGASNVAEVNAGANLANYVSSFSKVSGTGTCAQTTTTTGTATVIANNELTCEFKNVRKPTVTVCKSTPSVAAFDLFVAGNLEKDNATDGQCTGAVVISAPFNSGTNLFGPVTVAEFNADGSPVSGTAFHSFISCTDGTNGTGTSLSIPVLEAGEDVTCVITNTPIAASACNP